LASQPRRIEVNHDGVGQVWAMNHAATRGARIVVGMDSARPFGMDTAGNKLVLRILPHPVQTNATAEKRDSPPPNKVRAPDANPGAAIVTRLIATSTHAAPPEVEHQPVASEIDETADDCPATVRHRFRIKFIAG